MVPEEGEATRQAELIAQGIQTTCEQEPPGTVTLTLKYLPHTYHAKRDGQEKSGCKYPSPCMQALATPHTNPWGKFTGQHCFMFNLP